jgi:tetratricopeptide (TPR) repeat protein
MNFLAAVVLTTQLTLSGQLHDGLAALEAKKYDAAIASLTKIVDDKDPGNSFRELALHFRAEAYRGKGDKAKALADWATLLKQTRNDQLREPALAGYKDLGGDPKQLLPADSPAAVWGKFVAAAQKADLEGALALSTGLWRELIMKESKGDGGKLQREFGRDAYFVSNERIGEKDDAGKAWIELGREGSRQGVMLEFVLNPKSSTWLISGFIKNRNGDGSGGAANLNRLKQVGLALQMWAADTGAGFPDRLDALKEKYLQGAEVFLWVHPQKPEEKRPFEYCPVLNPKDDGNKLVAAAPVAVNGQREVLHLDGSVRLMKEEDFVAAARAQKWSVAGTWKKEDLSREQQDEVRQLVQQLGHADFKVRTAARAKLQAMGGVIAPVLEEFRDAADPEIRATVRELLAGR